MEDREVAIKPDVPLTPEAPKKGAPIYIIWETHGDVMGKSKAQLNKIIGDNLRSKESDNVVVFIEQGDISLS